MERSLELLTLDTEKTIQTINFGSTYYGTDLTKSFLIYNNGPDIAHFVVILEEGGEGQEVVRINPGLKIRAQSQATFITNVRKAKAY